MEDQAQNSGAPAMQGNGRAAHRFKNVFTKNQKLFIAEGMFMQSANVISSGVFLTGLLVLIGADDMTVGLIASAGGWAMLLSLISSAIMERVRNKKALMTWVSLAFRLLTTLPVFLPAILGPGRGAILTAGVMIVAGNAIFSLYNIGFTIFFMDSLPTEGRANYFYTRILYLRIAFTTLSLAMGFLLDFMNKSYAGFIVVFCTALAVGIADVVTLTKIKDESPTAGMGKSAGASWRFSAILRDLMQPLANTKYLRYLIYTFLLFFFLSVPTAFTGLYQLKYLNLSYGFISVITVCTYLAMILMTKVWGAIEPRIGRARMLALTMVLVACDLLVYSFLTKGTLGLIVLSPIFSGLGYSGYWACTLPYRYDLMPQEGKMAYEGWFWFAFGAAGLLGALCGGGLQGVLPDITTPILVFSKFQILYFFSGAAVILTALAFQALVRRDEAVAKRQASGGIAL